MANVRITGEAIIGARSEQQDAFAIGLATLAGGGSAKIAVLADGMGGHKGGSVASAVAVERFLRVAESGQWDSYEELLHQALLAANRAIGERAESDRQLNGMGCTLVAAIFDGRNLWTISVGDSLLLEVKPSDVVRLNADHSMAPLLDAEQPDSGQRHILRSALTGRSIALIDQRRFPLADDARIVIASDGLLTLSNSMIHRILAANTESEPSQQARLLLAAVSAAAPTDQDNCTVMIAVNRAKKRKDWGRWRLFAGALLLAGGAVVAALALYGVADLRSVTAGSGSTQGANIGDPSAPVPDASAPRPGYPLPTPPTPIVAVPATGQPESGARSVVVNANGRPAPSPTPTPTPTAMGATTTAATTTTPRPTPTPTKAPSPRLKLDLPALEDDEATGGVGPSDPAVTPTKPSPTVTPSSATIAARVPKSSVATPKPGSSPPKAKPK